MSVTIIVGGQYGSEGKGKVAHWVGMNYGCDYAVKTGTNNHDNVALINHDFKFKMFSSAVNENNTTTYVFPAGCLIEKNSFFEEVKKRGLTKERLVVDPYAKIINKETFKDDPGTRIAMAFPEFEEFLGDTKLILGKAVDEDKDIVIEGSQGYGLSPVHSEEPPWGVLRDTTAAGVLSEVGLSPLDIDNIILVIRSYPVLTWEHTLQQMKNEIDWNIITERCESAELIQEDGVVGETSLQDCRVAEFDPEMVRKAILVNNPTLIVLNHADYYDASTRDIDDLSEKQIGEITKIEELLDVQIDLVGNGSDTLIKYDDLMMEPTLAAFGIDNPKEILEKHSLVDEIMENTRQ